MMEKKKKIALFLGILLFSSGFTYHLNGQKSEEFSNHILSYTNTMEDDSFDIAAHRGFSSLEVENTEEAITTAADKKYVDYIEVDARLTEDGKLVLSHNDGLYVTLDQIKSISSMTYDEVMNQDFLYPYFPPQFSVWKTPEADFKSSRSGNLFNSEFHVIGLVEGLQCCGDKKVLLDLKFGQDKESFVEELKRELKNIDTSDVLFQSLDLEGIRCLRDHSDYPCLFLVDSKQDLSYVDEFDGVGIQYRYVTKELVDDLLDKGKIVAVWTIDQLSDLDRVVEELGDTYQDVVYITNYPDMIATELHDKQLVK